MSANAMRMNERPKTYGADAGLEERGAVAGGAEKRAGIRVGARADVVAADLEARDGDEDGADLLLDVCAKKRRRGT